MEEVRLRVSRVRVFFICLFAKKGVAVEVRYFISAACAPDFFFFIVTDSAFCCEEEPTFGFLRLIAVMIVRMVESVKILKEKSFAELQTQFRCD